MSKLPFRGQHVYLRWLQPGMGVKRWLLLLAGGLLMVALAVAALPQIVDLSAWWGLLQRLQPQGIGRHFAIAFLLFAGGMLVALAIFGLNRSLLSAYRRSSQDDVVQVVYRHRQRQRGPRIVAIGGGHGLNTLLRGLKEHTDNITAIVTVADDGGSSGKLRRDLGMLPPGDFRNCIAALSESEGLVSQLFQYRFGDDTELEGHSFGNLYLTAMTAITGSFESALEESGRVLAVRGRVVPSTLAQVTLCAERVQMGVNSLGRVERVCGESSIGLAGSRIERVYLEPENPPAYPAAIRAILDADLVVIGPGSLYTSVLPNLLVPDLARAIEIAEALKVYVCNVATQVGETESYDVSDYVEALHQHVGADLFRLVLANDTYLETPPPGVGVDWVRLTDRDDTIECDLVARDLVDRKYPWRHDSAKLATALMELLDAW
jgi:uncharacterized cofD-like protein